MLFHPFFLPSFLTHCFPPASFVCFLLFPPFFLPFLPPSRLLRSFHSSILSSFIESFLLSLHLAVLPFPITPFLPSTVLLPFFTSFFPLFFKYCRPPSLFLFNLINYGLLFPLFFLLPLSFSPLFTSFIPIFSPFFPHSFHLSLHNSVRTPLG